VESITILLPKLITVTPRTKFDPFTVIKSVSPRFPSLSESENREGVGLVIVTLFETPERPVADVAVNVPLPAVPANVSSPVTFATPEEKSPAWFRMLLLTEPRPETVPDRELVTVTLFVDALNDVILFPKLSWAAIVFVPVNALPFVCDAPRLTTNFPSVSGVTLTLTGVVEPIDPSVTVREALSTR
jgi:hypothetical protein